MVEVWDGRESGDEEQARGNRKPVDTKSNLGRSQIVRMSSHTQLCRVLCTPVDSYIASRSRHKRGLS